MLAKPNTLSRHVRDLISLVGLGAAIGSAWLMLFGGSLQLLTWASALVAASQLLFFFNEPAPRMRVALAHRIIAS